jgi:hypothetical protein
VNIRVSSADLWLNIWLHASASRRLPQFLVSGFGFLFLAIFYFPSSICHAFPASVASWEADAQLSHDKNNTPT